MSDFMIDGKDMPKPHNWLVDVKPMSQDAERLIGNGRIVVPWLGVSHVITWTYKFLSSAQYDVIFDAYIRATKRNKSFYHTITTRDSNSDDVLTFEMYTQSDFTAPLYRIKDGVRYYKDVKFVFVTRGGDDE